MFRICEVSEGHLETWSSEILNERATERPAQQCGPECHIGGRILKIDSTGNRDGSASREPPPTIIVWIGAAGIGERTRGEIQDARQTGRGDIRVERRGGTHNAVHIDVAAHESAAGSSIRHRSRRRCIHIEIEFHGHGWSSRSAHEHQAQHQRKNTGAYMRHTLYSFSHLSLSFIYVQSHGIKTHETPLLFIFRRPR